MLKQIGKVVLLVALLTALIISRSAPVFAGSCQFDRKTSQCINHGCSGCIQLSPSKCGCTRF